MERSEARRRETAAVGYQLVRESVVNALVHRDWPTDASCLNSSLDRWRRGGQGRGLCVRAGLFNFVPQVLSVWRTAAKVPGKPGQAHMTR